MHEAKVAEFQQLHGEIAAAYDEHAKAGPHKFAAGIHLGGIDVRAMALKFVSDIVLTKLRQGLIDNREAAIKFASEEVGIVMGKLIDSAEHLIETITPVSHEAE